MQIRLKEDMTCGEALMLLEIANAEVASLRQQLTEHEETIEQLTDENADLRAENAQLKLEMEAIGAGGVSGKRITDDGALEALQACEQAYHRMIVDGTPQDCRAHDAARVAFWRVFGGGGNHEQPAKHSRHSDGGLTRSQAETRARGAHHQGGVDWHR